ncbi:dTDP-4-dehydrorhamnose reductase [Phyllobacterium sp. SYP-B3895]|uniref:dTDP-4-dehydrorhamnose reductase n=1 Tax=Phyllobacterium sp. SYP-B3895 TaxID=2663240 RepID=UPI001299810A|nr:dTDP-4-dehydrorhamnose reductase [Phyllobacterium sp. SYP-B3895]MRG54220.1 dTDP-4-dehydrorhamnose reductase [Phyllobacterium sp. SYP-B3895]
MRIVVTGTEGQVVRSLVERAARHSDIEIIALGRPGLDLAVPSTVGTAIAEAKPDIVVSAAAYTAVDQAEDEPDLAHAINALGAGAVARAAGDLGVPVIHLSTDYVFAGDGEAPYTETDATGPQGVYGRTKLEGEAAVIAANPRHIILRTAWVYSPFGKNFVKTMLRLAETRDQVSVVSDQWGNPTSAIDIADAIIETARRIDVEPSFTGYGIYHLAGTGNINWSGFARAIFASSRNNGGPFAEVADIASADYPTKAKRPFNSRLSTDKFFKVFGWRAPDWQVSTEATVSRLLAEAKGRDAS